MVAAASVFGAFLRLHGLEKPSFWVDEFFTIARVGTLPLHWAQAFGYVPSWLSLWLHGVDLGQIGLGNIAEWPALGVSERAARLGSCWVGILTVPALAVVARPVVGAGVAGASALLVAITPWHLYWSQMARFYTTQFLFANVFILLFARGMQTGRRAHFAFAALAGVLALLSHPTTIFVIGACIAVVGCAALARVSLPNLGTGLRWLALLAGAFVLIAISREFPLLVHGEQPELESLGDPGPPAVAAAPAEPTGKPTWLGDKVHQSWGPSFGTLVLGTVLRIEPVIFALGLGWVIVAVRRRDALGIFVSAIAVLVPLGILALAPVFPIAPRYYFPCLFAWALLASMWAVEVDRRAGADAGRVIGITGLAAALIAVGFNAYLYVRDGSGARVRWREAYTYILEHGEPSDPVFAHPGGFQAEYYLGRKARRPGATMDVGSLTPGSWVVQRRRGTQPPDDGGRLELEARYEIPSKPWSSVLYVMRMPAP